MSPQGRRVLAACEPWPMQKGAGSAWTAAALLHFCWAVPQRPRYLARPSDGSGSSSITPPARRSSHACAPLQGALKPCTRRHTASLLTFCGRQSCPPQVQLRMHICRWCRSSCCWPGRCSRTCCLPHTARKIRVGQAGAVGRQTYASQQACTPDRGTAGASSPADRCPGWPGSCPFGSTAVPGHPGSRSSVTYTPRLA